MIHMDEGVTHQGYLFCFFGIQSKLGLLTLTFCIDCGRCSTYYKFSLKVGLNIHRETDI